MFQLLQEAAAAAEAAAPTVDVNNAPADWVRPMGGSRKTWANVYKNKQVLSSFRSFIPCCTLWTAG